MTRADLLALAPLILLAVTAAAVMLQIAIRRRLALTLALSLAGLTAALAGLPLAARWSPGAVTALVVVDAYGIFYIDLILLATMACTLLSYGYLRRMGGECEEYYLLLLLAALGAAVLVVSRHFAAFFLGLEILSVALYALIAYPRRRTASLEAGIKYLVPAAVSSAFLLFGMALVFMASGTLEFNRLAALLVSRPEISGRLTLWAGSAMIVVGIGFKLALVPFHMWAPDVYQGAPAPVAGFVATVSKTAVAALLLRLLASAAPWQNPPLIRIFSLLAIASMVGGNLLALRQNSVKRILAYSSTAHMGYLLVALMPGGPAAIQAVTFYLTAYTITNLGAFGLIGMLSHQNGDADELADFKGLALAHPWLGAAFTAMLLSLAGIPLTAGFVGKFYLVATGLYHALWLPVLVLLVTSGIGLYYYLRIVVVLFIRPEETQAPPIGRRVIGWAGGVVLAALSILLIWLGVGPQPLVALIQAIAG